MDLASAEGGDSEKLVALRKQIAGMGVYQKLFVDFQSLIKEIVACKELCEEEDKEIKKLAEEDLQAL